MLVAKSAFAGKGPAPLHGINFFPIYGQSLSVGQTPSLLSGTDRAYALMFQCGVRPQYTSTPSPSYTSLVPLKEQNDAAAPWTGVLQETACSGAADMFVQLMGNEAAAKRLLMSAPGYGAIDIAGLSYGSDHFARMTTQASAGRALATAAGSTYGFSACGWIQGESDYIGQTGDAAYYRDMLIAFANDLNTQARAGGQFHSPIVLVAQIASHTHNTPPQTPWVALGQLAAANVHPGLISMACAMYQLDYQGGNDWHLTADSERWLGAYLGLAFYRRRVLGLTTVALQPLSTTRDGNSLLVRWSVPVPPLTWDDGWITAVEDRGFEAFDAEGAQITISSVDIVSADTVAIRCASQPTSWRHAWTGAVGPGRETGPRGQLCDSCAIEFSVQPGDVRRMRSFALISDGSVT